MYPSYINSERTTKSECQRRKIINPVNVNKTKQYTNVNLNDMKTNREDKKGEKHKDGSKPN